MKEEGRGIEKMMIIGDMMTIKDRVGVEEEVEAEVERGEGEVTLGNKTEKRNTIKVVTTRGEVTRRRRTGKARSRRRPTTQKEMLKKIQRRSPQCPPANLPRCLCITVLVVVVLLPPPKTIAK